VGGLKLLVMTQKLVLLMKPVLLAAIAIRSLFLTENTDGVLSFWNLKEYVPDKAIEAITEYPLYTDAHVIGELTEGCEPYMFLNMIPCQNAPGVVCESIILRIYWYISANRTFEVKTDTSKYHGGWVTDELAALASLKLGIRLKAGGMTRTFDGYNQDSLGKPRAQNYPIPQLTVRNKRLVLPNVVKSVNLADLAELKALQNVNEGQYISLVRSARLYQDALWIAESEPALAWLMMISAVETAANQWSVDEASPSEKLKELKPELTKILMNYGGEDLLVQVAEQISPSLGATNKFIKFCLEFMPDAPMERPIEWAQIKWSKTSLRRILNKLYEYRSNALHGGTPFPEPMCRAPEQLSLEQGVPEKGCLGLAVHTLGASWKSEDLPINMNTFNYIVNGILSNWWSSLVG
jgi:hypothetical protein